MSSISESEIPVAVSDRQKATTIVRLAVPADEFALQETLQAVPDAIFTCEQSVESGTVFPLLWARGARQDEIRNAFTTDPTVRNATLLTECENKWLYRMEWSRDIQSVTQMLTNSSATILDAHGANGDWKFRMLYPDREECSKVIDCCADHEITVDTEMIREMDGTLSGRYGLTDKQLAVLRLAVREGYFEVPRSITLRELGEELGVSHQTLSERLRRATDSLIQNVFMV